MSISRWWRGFVDWLDALDTTRLKRVGVITYFGVYALLFFGIHRVLNRLLLELPSVVRPPLLDPVWVVMDLPQSLAMGTFSLGVTAAIVGAMVVKSAWTTVRGGDASATYASTPYDIQQDSHLHETEVAGSSNTGRTRTGGRTKHVAGHHRTGRRGVDRDDHRDERRHYHGTQSGPRHRNHSSASQQYQPPESTPQSEADATDEESWPEEWVGGDEI